MKNTLILICLSLFLAFSSCSDQDEYLKYVEGGEISYTGKIDSLEIMPGKNRVKLNGLITADPKVSEVRVYWKNHSDSIVIPIERTEGVDTVATIIEGLPENIYNFEVRTFDSNGNSSIPVYATGSTYGERYQESLSNRPVILNGLIDNTLTIDYTDMDRNSGVIGTEVTYTSSNDNTEKSVYVPIDSTSIVIEDFLSLSTYEARSVFLPEPTAIDTFYSDYQSYTPIPTPVLKNAAVPFQAASRDGRWGILAEPWITNDAVLVHNGYGGWDEWNGNIFNVESGWGAPAITNGKIYQAVEVVEPATFQLQVKVMNTNHQESDTGGAYFVVTNGDGLPDVENIASAPEVLGYKRVLESSPTDYKIEFTTNEPNQLISVGFLTTQADGWPGRFANVLSWKIVPVAE